MKSRWVAAGLESLRRGGVDAVRVERLATDLGITKGSFYWHFRNREELLEAVLEHWSREMTDAEFERIASLEGGLADRLLALAQDVLEKGMGRYDPAIRAWARAERRVAAAVAQVDRRRVRTLTRFFGEAGFAQQDIGNPVDAAVRGGTGVDHGRIRPGAQVDSTADIRGRFGSPTHIEGR